MPTHAHPSSRDVVALVGNPARNSRTRSVAGLVAGAIAGHPQDPVVVDLSELDGSVFDAHDAEVAAVREVVADASVLVVATPVYKGSFTGLLKSFLDGLPADALARTVLVPVVVGASSEHVARADTHLRSVAVELGARLPVPSFLIEERHLDGVSRHLDVWASRHLDPLTAATESLVDTAEVIG